MKTLHKKIVIFVVILTVVLSTLVVPCFALDPQFSGLYVFKDVVNLSTDLPYGDGHIEFVCSGRVYTAMYVDNESFPYRLIFIDSYFNEVVVYDSDSGWLSPEFQTIEIFYLDGQDLNLVNFLSDNGSPYVSEGWYNDIFNIIHESVFGGDSLSPEQKLSVSLLSTILSLLVILAPILICAFFFVWILKRV